MARKSVKCGQVTRLLSKVSIFFHVWKHFFEMSSYSCLEFAIYPFKRLHNCKPWYDVIYVQTSVKLFASALFTFSGMIFSKP